MLQAYYVSLLLLLLLLLLMLVLLVVVLLLLLLCLVPILLLLLWSVFQVTDVGFSQVSKLPQLRVLLVDNCCQITDKGLQHISGGVGGGERREGRSVGGKGIEKGGWVGERASG